MQRCCLWVLSKWCLRDTPQVLPSFTGNKGLNYKYPNKGDPNCLPSHFLRVARLDVFLSTVHAIEFGGVPSLRLAIYLCLDPALERKWTAGVLRDLHSRGATFQNGNLHHPVYGFFLASRHHLFVENEFTICFHLSLCKAWQNPTPLHCHVTWKTVRKFFMKICPFWKLPRLAEILPSWGFSEVLRQPNHVACLDITKHTSTWHVQPPGPRLQIDLGCQVNKISWMATFHPSSEKRTEASTHSSSIWWSRNTYIKSQTFLWHTSENSRLTTMKNWTLKWGCTVSAIQSHGDFSSPCLDPKTHEKWSF